MRKLFVGRLSRRTRVADVEDVFDRYGRLTRCDVKYGMTFTLSLTLSFSLTVTDQTPTQYHNDFKFD